MTIQFGPFTANLRPLNASEVTVTTWNDIPVTLDTPVTIDAQGDIRFGVAFPGRYKIVVRRYPDVARHTVDISDGGVSYDPTDIRSYIDYRVSAPVNPAQIAEAVEDYMAANPGAGGGGITDHGALNGLGDDDHTQYLNNTRGDARYTQSTVLPETIRDTVATFLTPGSGVTLTHDDVGNTLQVASTGGGGVVGVYSIRWVPGTGWESARPSTASEPFVMFIGTSSVSATVPPDMEDGDVVIMRSGWVAP